MRVITIPAERLAGGAPTDELEVTEAIKGNHVQRRRIRITE